MSERSERSERSESTPTVTTTDNPAASRYEALVDGVRAGFAAYRLDGVRVVFARTEIDSAFEGNGVGSSLAAQALDDVRRRGKRVVPRCPFIAAYINKHPEYRDLVDEH